MKKNKKLKFVIIRSKEKGNTEDLANEIEKRGHEVFLIRFKNLMFDLAAGKFKAKQDKIDLDKIDIFLFRGYVKFIVEAKILAEKLISDNKVVIEEVLSRKHFPSKLYESSRLNRYKIKHPKTFQVFEYNSLKSILNEMKFPIIIKPIFGRQGKGIEKINSKKEAFLFFKRHRVRNYLIQEYLKIDGDIRVFVVDGKVVGAMKRFIIPGDFRTNASLGAEAKKITVTKKLEKIALKATKAMELEVAGVDIVQYKKDFYVLEVNSAPQWQKFKEVVGINPAKNIIDLALRKYRKLNKN